MFEAGSRPHRALSLPRIPGPEPCLHRDYWQGYGWVAPDSDISGLEDEYRLSEGKPTLLYVKKALQREPRMDELLQRIEKDGRTCYRLFETPEELAELVADDLAVLLTERFQSAGKRRAPSGCVKPVRFPRAHPIIGRDEELAALADTLRGMTRGWSRLPGWGGSARPGWRSRLRDRCPRHSGRCLLRRPGAAVRPR